MIASNASIIFASYGVSSVLLNLSDLRPQFNSINYLCDHKKAKPINVANNNKPSPLVYKVYGLKSFLY